MVDNIKTYDAGHDSYGNPRFMVVNESRKWLDDTPYRTSRQGIIIKVKTKAELKKLKDALIEQGYIDRGARDAAKRRTTPTKRKTKR